MCTVSFIPSGNKVIITSNRDEKIVRPAALPPEKMMSTADGAIYYPVDAQAGGTWFIANTNGDVGVLLNGAYKKHQPQSSYRQSRGSILPALFNVENPWDAMYSFNFNGIENCTLVLYISGRLRECIWDGNELAITSLNERERYIWSSVTLYNEAMIAERKQWFSAFINNNPNPTQQEIIDFHTHTGNGNNHYGLKMNRDNTMLTVSITSASIGKKNTQLEYVDCLNDLRTTNRLPIKLATQTIY